MEIRKQPDPEALQARRQTPAAHVLPGDGEVAGFQPSAIDHTPGHSTGDESQGVAPAQGGEFELRTGILWIFHGQDAGSIP